MRRLGLLLLCTLSLAALAATAARAHPTPQIRAEQAHERAVVAQIGQIGRNLEGVVQEYDGAQLELQRVKGSLHRNEFALRVARGNLHAAQRRLMHRLYSLYVNGAPSAIDVLAGAKSLSQIIDRAEAAQVLSNQDAALGKQALRFEQNVQRKERQLKKLKARRQATVASLAAKKRQIDAALARQKQLLASIHTTIQHLQAEEAAREQRLRAQAEARRRAARRARAAARAAAAQQTAPTTAPQAPSTSGVVSPPVSVPVVSSGAGHPAAASIALRYLGVPYVWGGASPSGFDCSGLVQCVCGLLGVALPRTSYAQYAAGRHVTRAQLRPGDLVFFDGAGHVGIYAGGGRFIHAPHTGTRVQIGELSGWYLANYTGAVRIGS
jgi:peptidoglycan DL-endopeptidase CwlO